MMSKIPLFVNPPPADEQEGVGGGDGSEGVGGGEIRRDALTLR